MQGIQEVGYRSNNNFTGSQAAFECVWNSGQIAWKHADRAAARNNVLSKVTGDGSIIE
jgi:hypothetical protein